MAADNANQAGQLAALAEQWDRRFRASRKSGNITTALAVAKAAIEALEAAISQHSHPGNELVSALKTMRKITYNAAADAYPGWEVNTLPRTPADLAAAGLARKSLSLVQELRENAEHNANAVWLIGALDLAQGWREQAQAQASFSAAARAFSVRLGSRECSSSLFWRATLSDQMIPFDRMLL